MIMALLGFLSGCTGHNLSHYKESQPPLDLETYFSGPIKAWGLVQDRKGRVTRRFDVVMEGRWENGVGVLEEKFDYYDGETDTRVWTIKRIGLNEYEGTAGDIIDKATGQVSGNTMRWAYVMDLPVGETSYKITFDDWMFLMNDGVLINRSYLKKFGITVAELTLFMQKQE
jgi:hypothetical protein